MIRERTRRVCKASRSKPNRIRDIRPPNAPWTALDDCRTDIAPLSYYYSDSGSKIPIRDISHEQDPKADPNIETKTFGLFGTCDRPMRKTIVTKRIGLHFFITRRENVRVLTGYYRYGWYYEPPASDGDYMLAAREARFVSPGFRLCDLTGYLHGTRLDKPFRTVVYVKGEVPLLLLKLLKETPDATSQYIDEIKHIERELLRERGKLYSNRTKGFDWTEAHGPMRV